MHKLTAPVLYIAGNYNIDLIMGTLAQWPLPGTEVMLEHSALRPGGSAGNCALALAAMQIPHRTIGCQGDDAFTAWLAAQFPGSAERWPQYACETSLTVAVTHPDKERSFLSNYGHITRLSADDVLAQLPERATAGDIVLLCGTFYVQPCYRTIRRCCGRCASAASRSPWIPAGRRKAGTRRCAKR